MIFYICLWFIGWFVWFGLCHLVEKYNWGVYDL